MRKYNIITGWNRGGTSALMFALRQAGIPVIGFAYPSRIELTKEEDKNIKINVDSYSLALPKDIMHNNPNGFWEVPSICLEGGLSEQYEIIGMEGDLIKVPLDVLPMSSPKLVDKVVIILREPAKVIASQIKCKGVKKEKEYIKLASLGLMHNWFVSMDWIKKNKIKHHILYYENLLKHPYLTLGEVCDFLGRGNYESGAEVITKKLNRSKPVKSKSKEFKMIQNLYSKVKAGKDYAEYDVKKIQKEFLRLGGLTKNWR